MHSLLYIWLDLFGTLPWMNTKSNIMRINQTGLLPANLPQRSCKGHLSTVWQGRERKYHVWGTFLFIYPSVYIHIYWYIPSIHIYIHIYRHIHLLLSWSFALSRRFRELQNFSGVFNDDLRHERWIKRTKVGTDIQVK